MDTYANFENLAAVEREGIDFSIHTFRHQSRLLIIAPHGGNLEPMTAELARAVAGQDFSWYNFISHKPETDWSLHITSTQFDEHRALSMAQEVDIVVSIHGFSNGAGSSAMVGGRHNVLRTLVSKELQDLGIEILKPTGAFLGRSERNICNRGKTGAGVQIELSKALRDELRGNEKLLQAFVSAIRKPLLDFQEQELQEAAS